MINFQISKSTYPKIQVVLFCIPLFFILSVNVRAQTYSIFSSATVTDDRNNDELALEVGFKFRATQNGKITGIRYYKATGTTGTHTGNLWSATGTLLASATFTGETSSGWQQVSFSPAIDIAANTTYVASCFSPSGDYVFESNYFTQDYANGPVKALASGVDGVNGMFIYTNNSAFPSTGYNFSNYWVDIVFQPTGSETWNTNGNAAVDPDADFIGTLDAKPLVFKTKNTEAMRVDTNGRVTIGNITAPAGVKLAVGGNIITEKITVKLIANWADFVFDDNYRLPSLAEVEKYIRTNKHLPDMPSTAEVEKEGVNLGDNQAVLLRKIEELTLYAIEQNKQIENQDKKIEKQQEQIDQLLKLLKKN